MDRQAKKIVLPHLPSPNGKYTPDDIVQYVLLNRLSESERSIINPLSDLNFLRTSPLQGDWTALLDHLSEGQLDLIDSLFSGLDLRRSPAGSHIYLTFLTRLMGISVILSTNFDSLLEQAMRREGMSPRVFEIHRNADLPHTQIVHQQLSLVKLHGSAYGLRFGERLQHAIEDDARCRISSYIPDDSLLLVIGFSGWERRMMQVICDFAKSRAFASSDVQVLWLTTSRSPKNYSPYLSDMISDLHSSELSYALRVSYISDANTFLPGVYSRIASSFPPSRNKYRAIGARPAITKDPIVSSISESPPQKIPPRTTGPSVVMFSDAVLDGVWQSAPREDASIASWPSLAAAEFASIHSLRNTLWIDLETHNTVESVVRDILLQIRQIDPVVPQLILPTEPYERSDAGDISEITDSYSTLLKAVERIREAIQRGKYTIVFDSLESFCSPHLVHHGLPRWDDVTSSFASMAITRVHRLYEFIRLLIGVHEPHEKNILPRLYDAIIVVTVIKPSARHSEAPGSTNSFVTTVHQRLADFLTKTLSRDTINTALKTPPIYYSFESSDSALFESTILTRDHNIAKSWVAKLLQPLQSDADHGGWIEFAASVAMFKDQLRTLSRRESPTSESSLILLSILSSLRRPRSIATIRCLLARWLFDPGDLDERGVLTFAFDTTDDFLKYLREMRAIEWSEGEHAWIPRQIHEAIYEVLTKSLRIREFCSSSISKDDFGAKLIAGLVISTWHLLAARVYFADVYLPSHDEHAFFEYAYHRISALRYLALLQAMLNTLNDLPKPEKYLETIESSLSSFDYSIKRGSGSDNNPAESPADNEAKLEGLIARKYPRLARLLRVIGVFAFVRRDPLFASSLRHLESQDDETCSVRAIVVAIYHLRRHGMATFGNAFRREQDRICGTTSPDVWLGWIASLIDIDSHEISGRWGVLKSIGRLPPDFVLAEIDDKNLSDCFGSTSDKLTNASARLGRELTYLRTRLYRSKMEFRLANRLLIKEVWAILQKPARDSSLLSKWIGEFEAWSQSCSEKSTKDGLSLLVETTGRFREYRKWTRTDVYLLRCWCELARGVAGQASIFATAIILQSIRDIILNNSSVANEMIKSQRSPGLYRLEYDVIKGQAELVLQTHPVWSYFSHRDVEYGPPKSDGRLSSVERYSQQAEDYIRAYASTSREYAQARSHCLSIRARSLYLRGQFREAHRLLVLSQCDVGEYLERDRFCRFIANLFQAELLSISSRVHLSEGRSVQSCIRKVESALECIYTAERWLEPAVHRPMWWVRLYIGRAQVRHEQLLLAVRRIISIGSGSGESYARKSIWLEECALDGLRALRQALDTLPFVNIPWSSARDNLSPIVRAEIMVWSLWVRFFVSAFGYNHLLVTRLQVPRLVPWNHSSAGWHEYFDWTSGSLAPMAKLIHPSGFFELKWKPWNMLRQFYHVSQDSSKMFSKRGKINKALTKKPRSMISSREMYGGHSMREDLLDIGHFLIEKGIIGDLWDIRREPSRSLVEKSK